mgnify:CR=1 FL=1
MAEEPTGFLGRWARRKNDALQGKPLQEPAIAAKPVPLAVAGAQTVSTTAAAQAAGSLKEPPEAPATAQPAEKLLSLEDVKTLTQESDFTPFMARNVGPEVRNAAMKKLFADPQFNVMDGLDIYIDDYSKSDPIPESMLRQMTSAKFLNLFEEEEDVENNKSQEASQTSAVAPGDAASRVAAQPTHLDAETVAQSGASLELDAQDSLPADSSSQPEPSHGSGASQHDHAHSHLRLQPDHAAPAPYVGRGT